MLRRGLAGAAIAALAGAIPEASADLPQPSDVTLYETESTRSPTAVLETPHAISVVTDTEVLRARPAVSLDEAIDLVPGVFAQGGRNFAQDSRVSIRGYGARAEFGVRGIRMYVDGAPTTLPDGQTEVDSLDLAFVERIDVVRSQVSSLYGGGGGGILNVDTISPTPEPTVIARTLFGSHHLSRYSVATTGTLGQVGYALGIAHSRISGYRDHARGRQSTLLAKLEREFENGWRVKGAFSAVWAPEAQDAGGLTRTEVSDDRTQARLRNVVQDAGEELDQQKLSVVLERAFAQDHDLRLMAYALQRDFENKLPINRQVEFDRSVFGGAVVYRQPVGPLLWTLGLDADEQQDHRLNFDNVLGTRGALSLDQSETVRSVGPWAQARLRLPGRISLVAGARYDWYEFVVGDRFAQNGDRSDRLRFRELSPTFGVHWNHSERLQAYANMVSAFRVPTTTELSPSDNAGGFGSDLDPEKTRGLELGFKGLVFKRHLAYDIALFDLHIHDVAVPVELPSGEEIFRDAGKVRRRGVEVALSALLTPGLTARVGYTYADYRYRDFDTPTGDFDGNHEPNTPKHLFGGELRYEHPSGWFAVISLRHFSRIEVNDANVGKSDAATLSDFRAGRDIEYRGWILQPFFGLRNYTEAKYDQTLRPNAFGGRYYEPAPLIEVYGGIEVRFGRD